MYVLPNFQNPTGRTMSAERRVALAKAAAAAGVPLVEDNPYGDLWFDAPPPRPLAARWPEGTVYLGSFSKTIASGLRVGWALAPHAIREKLVIAAESAILCPSNFAQMTVSSYLETQPWRDNIKVFRELEHFAHHDRETGLLNRSGLMQRVGDLGVAFAQVVVDTPPATSTSSRGSIWRSVRT